jgi:hypothetical protein
MSEYDVRREAYRYILERLRRLPAHPGDMNQPPSIALSEIMLLKDGLAAPSSELVALLKQLLRGSVTQAEIEAHLVEPFVKI